MFSHVHAFHSQKLKETMINYVAQNFPYILLGSFVNSTFCESRFFIFFLMVEMAFGT